MGQGGERRGLWGRRLDHELLPRVGLLAKKALGEPDGFDGFPGGGSNVCPSLLGHDDLIFQPFIVGCENSLSPSVSHSETRSSVINLPHFGLPSESRGHICEAPPAATLC